MRGRHASSREAMRRLGFAANVAKPILLSARPFAQFHGKAIGPSIQIKAPLHVGQAFSRKAEGVGIRATFTSSSIALLQHQQQHQHNGLFRLLSDEQRCLLDEQRNLVQRVRDLAHQVGGGELRDYEYLDVGPLGGRVSDENSDGNQYQLSDFAINSTCLVVIAGEFNAGKSTLVNALVGEKLLETGALPTTDTVQVLAHGSSNSSNGGRTGINAPGGFVFHSHESPLLHDLTLIDTPGTNAVHSDHTRLTRKLLPVADLILFVTSADRPFPESERVLLRSIQSYRKNVAIILNKMDTLELSGGDHGKKVKEEMVGFVSEHASDLLGARPVVLAVSARDALGSKSISPDWVNSAVWKRSNFEELEKFLSITLTDRVKLRSKMLNPLGVAEGMLDYCMSKLNSQKNDLETDLGTLRLLESQMKGWTAEVDADMKGFVHEAGRVLQSEGERCQEMIRRMSYVDQWQWSVLGDTASFEEAWSKADQGTISRVSIEDELLTLVLRISDDIATRARAQGQAIIEYLGKRPAVTSQSLVGSVTAASRFEDTRQEMQEKMSELVMHVCSSHDPVMERNAALKSLRTTALASGALFAGALVNGAACLAGPLDWTIGLSSASAMAIIGASIVPYRNRYLAVSHQQSWDESRERLDRSLATVCSIESDRIKRRILNGISPYTRYVNIEQERIERLTRESEDLANASYSLRNRIIKLTT